MSQEHRALVEDATSHQRSARQEPGPVLLEALWQYRWLVLVTTVVAAAAAFGASLLQPAKFEGEADLLLADPRNVGVFRDDTGPVTLESTRYVRNQARFIDSRPVYSRAAELLDEQLSVQQLAERTTVQPSVDLDLITIRATAPTPEAAAAAANAVGRAYQDLVAEEVRSDAQAAITELDSTRAELQQRISDADEQLAEGDDSATQAERDAAVSQLSTLEGRADQIAVDATLYGSGVDLFEESLVPEAPVQPRPLRNAAVVAVLALAAATAFARWRADHARSADVRGDPAPVIGAPALGQVREFDTTEVGGSIPSRSAPQSPEAEAYQFVVSALEFALSWVQGSSVLVTSATPAEGKTTTAVNLAVAAAHEGRRVTLVDADERQRDLTALADAAPQLGLTDLADEAVGYERCTGYFAVGDRRLPFVPAGGELQDPAAFFRAPGFRTAMKRIKQHSELVIVDTPPLLAVADTSAIGAQVDGIVVVVTRGTPLRVLADLRERLDFVGTPVLGYVFNRVSARASGGYGYGYRYGSPADHTAPTA